MGRDDNKGAQAVALSVFLARSGASKAEIRREIATRVGYDLARTVASIRPGYTFDEAHWGVPDSIAAEARKRLPGELLAVLERFSAGFCR